MNYNNNNQNNLISNTNNIPITDNYLNSYGYPDTSIINPNTPIINPTNLLGNISNDNLINMTNNIDPNSLNGTLLTNNISGIYTQQNVTDDNKSLIKSLAKEIMNDLKENNMSLYDNSSINSRHISNSKNLYDDDLYLERNSNYSNSSSKKSKKNKKKTDSFDSSNMTEHIENFVVNSTNIPTNYIQWFFEDCLNYKDFLVLFILYFILSQDMIKDFFASYFSSLNPDNEGKIGVKGVIIYGLILTVLFMIIKKLV